MTKKKKLLDAWDRHVAAHGGVEALVLETVQAGELVSPGPVSELVTVRASELCPRNVTPASARKKKRK
jgi:hypothetical protein